MPGRHPKRKTSSQAKAADQPALPADPAQARAPIRHVTLYRKVTVRYYTVLPEGNVLVWLDVNESDRPLAKEGGLIESPDGSETFVVDAIVES